MHFIIKVIILNYIQVKGNIYLEEKSMKKHLKNKKNAHKSIFLSKIVYQKWLSQQLKKYCKIIHFGGKKISQYPFSGRQGYKQPGLNPHHSRLQTSVKGHSPNDNHMPLTFSNLSTFLYIHLTVTIFFHPIMSSWEWSVGQLDYLMKVFIPLLLKLSTFLRITTFKWIFFIL